VPKNKTTLIVVSKDDIWHVIPLEFGVRADLFVDQKPHLEILDSSLETHSNYMVILIDKKKARILTVGQGEILSACQLLDDNDKQNIKSTGRDQRVNRADSLSRQNDHALQRFIAEVAKTAEQNAKTAPIEHIVLGGHKAIIKRTSESLSKPLQSRVVLGIAADLNMPDHEILAKSKQVIAGLTK
jgi:peptide subunit release factor 1 (eRF1)